MSRFRTVFFAALALWGGHSTWAQDYRPFIPACAVDYAPLRTGMTVRYAYEGKWYVVGFCSTTCRTKFLQNPAGCMAAALEAYANASKKETQKKNMTGPCDLHKVVKTPWCPMCDRELGKDDLHNGLCKKCDSKPIQAEFCVKGTSPSDRARVTFKCDTCGATSYFESPFKHEADCKARPGATLKKICSMSGIAPHATEAH